MPTLTLPLQTPTIPPEPLYATEYAIEIMRLLGDGDIQLGLDALLDTAINTLPSKSILALHHAIYRDHKQNLTSRDALATKYGYSKAKIGAILLDYKRRLEG
jgi:superfamily I DNA and/or RNA helicase